jgi:hypothetical protein
MHKSSKELRQPTLQQHNVIGSLLGLKNQEIAFRVFFFDGSDYSTGQMLSFNEAMSENYVEWDLHKLCPTDECSIITRFTGFYDKNYNPIWEGDIVSKAGAVIVWHQPLGCWCFQFKNSKEAPTPLYYDNNLEKSEVLGNVFENPELLEGIK